MNQPRSELPAPVPASVLGEGTERYDVVVIGFGLAGGSAALEAARAGARVLTYGPGGGLAAGQHRGLCRAQESEVRGMCGGQADRTSCAGNRRG
jgi:glycine/D-amino acid oxidase-like deaminating enzyme